MDIHCISLIAFMIFENFQTKRGKNLGLEINFLNTKKDKYKNVQQIWYLIVKC